MVLQAAAPTKQPQGGADWIIMDSPIPSTASTYHAASNRRYHQGRHRHRRNQLEHSGPDLCAQTGLRKFILMARDLSAGNLGPAAHSSDSERVHLYAGGPFRLSPRRKR